MDSSRLTWHFSGGFLHLFFEGQTHPVIIFGWHTPLLAPILCYDITDIQTGYFVLNHAALASSQSLFAQLWKEYSLSDSRYLTSDPFMLCIETLTVVSYPSPLQSSLLAPPASPSPAHATVPYLLDPHHPPPAAPFPPKSQLTSPPCGR